MAEQKKKLPDIRELLQVKQQIRDTGSKADMQRIDDLILKRKKMDEGLVKATGVTGEAGKELYKAAGPGDQTFRVKIGTEKIDTQSPIARVQGVTQKIDTKSPVAVGTKDIFGTAAKAGLKEGSEEIAETVAKKAGKFLGKGRVAGIGAFLTGMASALRGEQASASDMAAGAAEALAPAGVSEALRSEALGPSKMSADLSQRAMAKIESGEKLTAEEEQALKRQREETQLEMRKYRAK